MGRKKNWRKVTLFLFGLEKNTRKKNDFPTNFFLCLELGKLIKKKKPPKIGKIKPSNLLFTFYKVSLKTTTLQSNIIFIWAIFKQHTSYKSNLTSQKYHTISRKTTQLPILAIFGNQTSTYIQYIHLIINIS